jgi:hypothetical protein
LDVLHDNGCNRASHWITAPPDGKQIRKESSMWTDAITTASFNLRGDRSTEITVKLLEVELKDSDILEWVVDNFQPEDVFSLDTLRDWARADGFVEGEED